MKSVETYLSFLIQSEYFAVNVAKVLEVLQKQKITRVPNVTSDIKGVTNFRGDIIPVFETRVRFGLADREPNEKYVIIVLEIDKGNDKTILGAMVDRVKDVINIPENQMLTVPKMNDKVKEELITAIYKLNDEFIMILDVDKMFTSQELLVSSEMKSLPGA